MSEGGNRRQISECVPIGTVNLELTPLSKSRSACCERGRSRGRVERA
jgi:hypothetical protein